MSSEVLLIKNGIVVTLDKKNRIIENGAVIIEKDRIIDVGKTGVVEKKYRIDSVIDARKKAVIPGLIDTHSHSSLIRPGMGPDMTLEWLIENWWRRIDMFLKPEHAYAGALLSYSEAIRAGTTCIVDMHRFMDRCADAAEEVGIRAILAPMSSDKLDFMNILEDNEKLIRERHGSANGRISIWLGPYIPHLFCTQDFLVKTRDLANKYHVGIHTHVSESLFEVESVRKEHGKRPIEYLYDIGLLGPDFLGAHCVWLSTKEIQIMRQTGSSIAHNPCANMKLANGIAPIPECINAGVNVGLGTDGDIRDMFRAMLLSALLQKVDRMDPSVMPADRALELATIGGAKAIGLDKYIGSIEKGKKGDIVIVDLCKPRLTPVLYGEHFNVISHLMYSGHGCDVDTVIIDGRVVVENRKIKTVEEQKVIEKASEEARDLLDRMPLKKA